MSTATDLGEFLRARRSRLRPEDILRPNVRGQRDIAGPRREEIARLAGLSLDYYTRMEQGRIPHPSSGVLDALAAALCLDGDAARHLHRLARPQSAARHEPRRRARLQQVRPMLRRLTGDLVDSPAVVVGRRTDILAWNTAACALFGDYAALHPAQRNIARITFLDEASRALYTDWPSSARENVARLHRDAVRHPEDPQLASLIGELSMRSEDFCRWWAEPPVRGRTSGSKRFHHPVVGDLELAYETLRPADDPEQALITYAAEPGSASHDALRMLLARSTEKPPAGAKGHVGGGEAQRGG